MEMSQLSTTRVRRGAEIRQWKGATAREKKKKKGTMMEGLVGVASGWMMERFKQAQAVPDVALLLLGEFQSVAEDLESRLFITESTCLGRLTAETEHLPKKPRERHTDVHKGHIVERNRQEQLRRHELC